MAYLRDLNDQSPACWLAPLGLSNKVQAAMMAPAAKTVLVATTALAATTVSASMMASAASSKLDYFSPLITNGQSRNLLAQA